MGLNGIIVVNRYYSDKGLQNSINALIEAFKQLGIDITVQKTPLSVLNKSKFCAGFALFLDKDIYYAKELEKNGVRVFNTSRTIELCDDKILTYQALKGIEYPKTISAPLKYKQSSADLEFCEYLIDELGFPMVFKHNKGSLGEQVFLIKQRQHLINVLENYQEPAHFQQFISESAGCDIRVYLAGHKVIGCIKRVNNEDFRSNICLGGQSCDVIESQRFIESAQKISKMLNMDFGSVDFLDTKSEPPLFLEANSNAYLNSVLKFDAPALIARHIKEVMSD